MLKALATLGLLHRGVRLSRRVSHAARPWVTLGLENVRVIDGDTFEADLLRPSGETQRAKVRCISYDAPEMSEPQGNAAKLFLYNIFQTDNLHLSTQWERDKFGRLLGHLIDSEGTPIANVFSRYNLNKWQNV